MKKISSKYLLVATFLLSAACGKVSWLEGERANQREEFTKTVHEGRRVNYRPFVKQTPDGFGLVGSSSEEGGAAAGWQIYDTTKMAPVARDGLKAAALAHLAQNAALFAVATEELYEAERFEVTLLNGLVVLNFLRAVSRFPVKDAFVEVVFAKDETGTYRLSEVINRSYGAIDLADTDPFTLGADLVMEKSGLDDFTIVAQENIIYPQDAGLEFSFILAAQIEARDNTSDELFTLFMDRAGTVLEAFSHRLSASETALQAAVYDRNYMGAKVNLPFSFATVTLSGQTLEADGDGGLALGGKSGSATIKLASDRVTIYNGTGSTPVAMTKTVSESNLLISGSEEETRGLNTFLAIQRANRFTRKHLTSEQTAMLTLNVNTKINVSGSCNAFYDTQKDQISLYSAGQGCANMALVNDVIYHEWGHGLDANAGKTSGITDGAYSEGIGDILAAYMTNSSNMAPGFKTNDGTGIRNIDNTKRFPEDKGEVHAEGLIIGGAFWDLREALIARYGETKGAFYAEYFFFNNLLTTNSYQESYNAVLRLDDDDNNLATRSANFCLITKAFADHGLTEEEDCTDPVKEDVPVDSSLVLGLKDRDSSGATVLVSVTEADSVEACFTDRDDCLKATTREMAFELEGGAGGKKFFVSKSKKVLPKNTFITVVTKDAQKTITGARVFKIFEK